MVATLLYLNRYDHFRRVFSQTSSTPNQVTFDRDAGCVNASRADGFTPLHLLAARTEAEDKRVGLIPLDQESQVSMRIIEVDFWIAFKFSL